jgi:hypothetical protein
LCNLHDGNHVVVFVSICSVDRNVISETMMMVFVR